MGKDKETNIKNWTYNFFNDIINFEEFKVYGHTEEKIESQYLVFDSTDESKEVLKKYTEHWDGIKNEIETITGDENGEYGKDFMKIKVNADDNLPLNQPWKLHLLTIIVRCMFEEDSKFLRNFIYTSVCMSYKEWYSLTELKILRELILIKLINQNNVKSVITNILTMVLNLIQKFVIDVTRE